ncbi:MAG TPA: glycosyltransferase [Candidatus Limnocylindria bacterium]|nr:glycosyltransferase [Candidatus Limnocylindria bacterium]
MTGLRVLLTTESYLPHQSGVTVAVDALARGLKARGHDVVVLAPRPARGATLPAVGSPGPAPRYAWLESYQLPAVAPLGYRMPWPLPWSAGLEVARAHRPQVVHAHSPFVTGLMARRLARAFEAPLVFTHHTRYGDYAHYAGPVARLAGWGVDEYLERFWRACTAVIAPSTDLAAEIRSSAPSLRIEVIPTGVDVAGLGAVDAVDPRPLAGWPDDAVVAASLGRLAPEKSPHTLLEALAIAVPDVPRLRLLLIGGGPSEADLRRRAAAPDLAGKIAFTGTLPRPEALARLAGADLFVFASQTETQGLVLAEALSVGLPAVALEGPGVRDSVRDGIDGRVVRADDPHQRAAELAQAMASLAADDTARAASAERARAGADRFSIERRIEETEALYRSVLR